ncbi:hypothetical protein EYB45_08915 [Erythrobacteraceae bacterium CFH 75059]|uniref:TrbG/VirB9 family P-type conjugative transfer protein n=1 Tax=Qipengyuania thermophila TaxID=2509361 RepID=UPI0010218AD8|nr:TrbG/VirB9 family P-type conjugative transfer protein [Qipengyuania thermophila]TCD04346.1 hypothetical protein EYB45_08915 [Erythrobacteraceae bacterium CFH 75059]
MNSAPHTAADLAKPTEWASSSGQTGITALAAVLLMAGCAGGRANPPSGILGAPAPALDPFATAAMPLPPQPALPQARLYRLSGDGAVRPLRVTDDGVRTTVAFAPEQALPAVFAIGPTGEELVVNGYMRGDAYVIDRIHDQLVFRIDRARATARRLPDAAPAP